MNYNGPERRRHRVLSTKNTEYHMRGATCIGVRDLETGEWQPQHDAIGRRLVGGFTVTQSGAWNVHFGRPKVGDRLCFDNDVCTTTLRKVRRPGLETVTRYPTQVAA